MTSLEVLADAAAVHDRFARMIADEIAAHNRAGEPTRLILPVGPTGQYPILADICNSERISWRNVHVVTMDEYLDWQGRPVSIDHPLSFRGIFTQFRAQLDDELALPPDQYVSPDPFDIDRAEAYITRIGGIDTCYGGIGVHGHVAFNEPPISRFGQVSAAEFRASLTRVVPLAPETITMNATRSAGGRFSDFPSMAVTIGMRDILAAGRIRLFCDGGLWQQEAVRRALHGPVEVAYPVSLLRDHADVLILADRITAARTNSSC